MRMNLVKGVASLLGRTSSGQSRESASSSTAHRLSPPAPRIRFSESGHEGILQALWERYDEAIDKVEKKKFFQVFLGQFLETYNNWEPVNLGILSEYPSAAIQSSDDVVIGCSAGHPTEVILTLIEEIRQLTVQVTDVNTSMAHSATEFPGPSTSINLTSEGLAVLDAVKILTRSIHNCKFLRYYGGIQKLTALMKGAVVQLKTISGALSGDENISDLVSEKVRLLQQILFNVVSIICSFINLNSSVELKAQMHTNGIDFLVDRDDRIVSKCESSSTKKEPLCEMKQQWQQKAVVSVMEAGGLNWLVELLRVMRRLSMKEQWTDILLQYLTLRTLHLALADNTRGQSHFKSIGGLDVLLDGLAILSNNLPNLKNISSIENKRDDHPLHKMLQLHILYLEVLRLAVFGNLNNLQYLCENGRVHKFANSFCSPAFVLQEVDQWAENLSLQDNINIGHETNPLIPCSYAAYPSQLWEKYVLKLSKVLCSFVLSPEDIKSHQEPAGKTSITISSVYGSLSIKWILRVLLIVFPCVKACANRNEFPDHIKVFIETLQCAALDVFRNILALSPVSLDVLRNEGIWDLLFSDNFFYPGGASEQNSGEWCNVNEVPRRKSDLYCMHSGRSNGLKASGLEIQMKVISLIEFAATSAGSNNNLRELSVLLDALEQTACIPEISGVLAKAVLRILQSSAEKTIASLKALNGVARLLKVACIQAKELRRPGDTSPVVEQTSHEVNKTWVSCMETVMELLSVYFAMADDARSSVLHSSECVDSLFELFWEESLRDHVMKYIMDLMKIVPFSEEDERAKMQLCSKYLEAFNHIKEGHGSLTNLSVSLLIGMEDMLLADRVHYQALFRDGECFLHIVSLLNGNLFEANSDKLVLHVLHTLTLLLANNDTSKASFRSLVGKGYKTLQNLLLDFCQWNPSEELLNTLLDMLVDGKFDMNVSPTIKNEDVIILYASVLQKSSNSLRHYGLDLFQKLLKDSLSNRASCARAGMLNFLLDWFSLEDNENIILKIAQIIQVIGGHSISGKDIRKIFAILRSEKIGAKQQYCSLLLTCVLSMLKEKGPTAFFDLIGNNSGIIIKTPLHWPLYKGYSFSCWLRVEDFPISGTMGLFKFVTESGRGCLASLMKDKLIYESFNMKQQHIPLNVNLMTKKWHFLCITHSIGRAFSGSSLFKCYLDGDLAASERCRYPKVNELITDSTIGTKINWPMFDGDSALQPLRDSSAFYGQIGPVYVFNEALSPEQVQHIYSRGPSYMYSFLDNEGAEFYDIPLPKGVPASSDGLGSKILFGLSAQASSGRKLFNVSPDLYSASEKSPFEANLMVGTQLCSRRLLQQIIYCVGGVSVFFPLVLHSDEFENEEKGIFKHAPMKPIIKDQTSEVIALVAAVLDENLENQQQMHILSGFSILGFLLQSVPPQQLNLQTLSALKHLFSVVANGNLAELLVKDAISSIFLNPLIWLYTTYEVQRELYMFLIRHFDKDPMLLNTLCQLPRVIDIISQFYWDVKTRFSVGGKPLRHPVSQEIIGERPSKEEIHKLRLLLLSIGEMRLRQNITMEDVKALTAFFETSQDTACVEDVLHMVIRAISQKQSLALFLEQVNLIGGCHIFINLLQREFEPVRLLSLQFIGRLLVGLPFEKKGLKIFNLTAGRSKFMSETSKKISMKMQPFFSAISDRIFKFSQTDNLCATLFDVLLGGASPKQVLQKNNQLERQKDNENTSHFFLPEILNLIFKFLTGCQDVSTRIKIIQDLLDLLDSNTSNIEALMENGWNAWLRASVKLDVLEKYGFDSLNDSERYEQNLVRGLYSLVLCHYIHYIKGGWQQLEETVNFLLMHCEQGSISYRFLLRDVYDEILQRLINLCSLDNIFIAQPCRDNTLYLLKLVDEMLMSEIDYKLPFPACCFGFSVDTLELKNLKEYGSALCEILKGEPDDHIFRNPPCFTKPVISEDDIPDDKWWNLYDNIWIIISEINGKGLSKSSSKSSTGGPSLSQRARGLVESLNIPAAEMAAVVVSGGISNALGGRQNKTADKAMLLRGEKCPRIVFRLVILYLCRSSLERASQCVKQVTPVLSTLLAADDEPSKSRLQLFIGALVAVKSKCGKLDDGARFHVIAHLLREAVICGKSVLATGIGGQDESSDLDSNFKEIVSVSNLLQKDRVIAAAAEEMKYIKASQSNRAMQLHELHARVEEILSSEYSSKKDLEDEIQICLKTILSSDESRRAAFRLLYEEQQQNVTEKWMHLYRSLIDERGPWSANPFPNNSTRHWKLDKTEDSWRRRLKLKQNYHFDERLCHPSTVPRNEANPSTNGMSNFVGHIPEQMKQFLLKGVRRIADEGSSDPSEDDSKLSGHTSCIPAYVAKKMDTGTNNQNNIVLERKEFSSLVETESNEVLMSVQCVLVTPKRKLAGHLAVMKNFLHFFGEFLVEGTGGSNVFKNFQASSDSDLLGSDQKRNSLKRPIILQLESEKLSFANNIDEISGDMNQKRTNHVKRHRRWKIGKVKAVHWTWYLLRNTAIEIFFSDSTAPIFLNFSSQSEAKDVGNLVVATRNECLFPKGNSRDKSCVISFVDRRVAVEMAETARESWKRRDISNFEYLMILNSLAGRSYNDLTQYPVFPWVLADYTSEDLDFNRSTTFRDLTKPVGALDSKRFEVFKERYHNFCDPDIPSFHYGSHYSSMGIVLYYLLRLEPFTSLHRSLQGGKFDHADRLFQSIDSTYRNCLTNTSDVKELIPEFFYMPEFLVNSNSYHLGVKQDGEPLGDVCLPPWAKGSPEEFIRKNREALESEYVSSNLHHWIDLVFGYKQRGKPSEEAANIFYYLTYEGAIDLDAIEDDLQRSAIEDQIANFGQTPIQIFRKKHPRRGPPIPIAHPLYYAPASINLTSIVCSTNNPPAAVLYIRVLESNIILVNQGLALSVKMWLTTQLQSGGNFTFSGSQEPFFGIGSDILAPRRIGSSLAENFEVGAQCFTTLQTSLENYLISCGNWENSFQVISLADGRTVQSIRHHKDVVTCVAVASDGSAIATGSYDTTVMLWEVVQYRGSEKRARNTRTEFPRKDYVIVETPFHILCGHDDVITCLYVSAELDIVISGSRDATCVFHTLREGRYVRSLRHPSGCALSKLAVSRHGRIAFYSDDDLSLHLYSINGKHLASSESNGRLNCIELSVCGEFLVCAGDQGQIVVRSMNLLEVVGRYGGVGKVITSLTVTAEECFLAGTKDGNLLVYSIENQHSKANISRNSKSKSSATG